MPVCVCLRLDVLISVIPSSMLGSPCVLDTGKTYVSSKHYLKGAESTTENVGCLLVWWLHVC